MKKFFEPPRPCCADNLEEWNCGCSFGCACCHLDWKCSVCSSKFTLCENWVRGVLEDRGILGSKIQIFKVQLSIFTSAEVEQIMVYNKKRTIVYLESATTEHGKKLRLLFKKKPSYEGHKLFVKAAFSQSKGIILPYEYANRRHW